MTSIIRTLRPETHPNRPDMLANNMNAVDPDLERKWMLSAVESITSFNLAWNWVTRNPEGLPLSTEQRIATHWCSHFWPSIQILVNDYILPCAEDYPLFDSKMFTQYGVFQLIRATMNIFFTRGRGAIGLPEATFHDDVAIPEILAKMFICYLERYGKTTLPIEGFLSPAMLPAIRLQPASRVYERDCRVLPIHISYLRLTASKPSLSAAMSFLFDLGKAMAIFDIPMHTSSAIPTIIIHEHPERIGMALRLWRKLLSWSGPLACSISSIC